MPWLTKSLLAFCLALAVCQGAAANEVSEGMFHDGFELLKAKKWEEAIKKFEQGLKIDPDNATARFYLGEAHHGARHPQRARSNWQRALDADPEAEWAPQARKRLAATQAPAANEGRASASSSRAGTVMVSCRKLSGAGADILEFSFRTSISGPEPEKRAGGVYIHHAGETVLSMADITDMTILYFLSRSTGLLHIFGWSNTYRDYLAAGDYDRHIESCKKSFRQLAQLECKPASSKKLF
jgi:tetratricopeptide (TPR) repeat protein